MKIQEAVASVQNAPGSMYTREDVVSLLNKLEAPQGGLLSKEQIKGLINAIVDQVESNTDSLETDDVCETSSAEFELNGNEISLQSIDINTDGIKEAVLQDLGDVIEDFFGELERELEDENE